MLLRGCCQLSFVNRIFLFGNFQSFLFRPVAFLFGFGFSPFAFAFWAFSWLASSVTAFQLPLPVFGVPQSFWRLPSALICSSLNLLAFIALKVLSNNHLHLLVIRFAFVVLSFPLSDFPSLVLLFVRLQGSCFHGFSSARVH